MKYRFIFTTWFDRNLKSLRKHNPSLRSDFESFLQAFDAEAHPIIPRTGGARKARMSAKGRGKRGGYRVVYYFVLEDTVWLLTIYDKVQKENLSPDEEKIIQGLIEKIQSP
ncbi:MAG: type II toxin-antitoxin system RelE/ParE family toxin [Anaerolineae bacterium]|nr:type II toxin-antitoxin system RelE/ParE family toxin [Anaerolineae bacterium]MBL8107027.1 type II toxin-antitoxin system RelE/ParE family toxin [Anaerolineales bacterium]MCC7191038.1 type II toxin-antitoxin system RelE/ParE family toxin [Anaerolineales bacterium]HQU36944.1 type II toxin-antitoxin system RelE/ParE family toxin [Anaerolineales bacterium]